MPEEVSNEDFTVAMSGPAVASNRFIGTINGDLVRIAFLEQAVGLPAFYRTAVILNQTDVAALIDLLMAYAPQPPQASPDGKQ